MTTIPQLVTGTLTNPTENAVISAAGTGNQPTSRFEARGGSHMVANDLVLTVDGANAYADSGTLRAVARALGPSYGYSPSTAPTLIRAGEFQSLRGAGTEGGTWGIEVGVHAEVPGDGYSKNVGIYIAASHTGWLNSGVRADTAVVVTGEDGWGHVIRALDTDGSCYFDVDGAGNAYMRGWLSAPNIPYFQGSVSGVATTGNDALLTNVDALGMNYDNNGVGGGTRIFFNNTATYEVSASVLTLEPNTQVQLFKNGVSLRWGAAGGANIEAAIPNRYVKANAGDYLTLRCGNGSFGANTDFSHISVRLVG